MKLCKDCKYYGDFVVHRKKTYFICKRYREVSMVTGRKKQLDATKERNGSGECCGKEAQYFEAKD